MPYDNIHTLCHRFTNLVENMGMIGILQDLGSASVNGYYMFDETKKGAVT